ncbi:MAG: reverse transcriptase/maturase family protein [Candidatus Pollutiaquabacter aromativorans]
MLTEELWEKWAAKESKNYIFLNGKQKYLKRGYKHFDNKIWFPDRKNEIKAILQNKLKVTRTGLHSENRAFLPFLKQRTKKLRIKYNHRLKRNQVSAKLRPICYASHLDSLIFSFYGYALNEIYENYLRTHSFSESILAYRSSLEKSTIEHAIEAFSEIIVRGNCSAIAVDIKSYFDSIDHKLLYEMILKVYGNRLPDDLYLIFQNITRYSYVRRDSLVKTLNVSDRKYNSFGCYFELIPGNTVSQKFDFLKSKSLLRSNATTKSMSGKGIPQGSTISAVLSNIYLIDLDYHFSKLSKLMGFSYRRYCDDILIICNSNDSIHLLSEIRSKITDYCKLNINDSKTELIDFIPNNKGRLTAFRSAKLSEYLNFNKLKTNKKNIKCKSLQYLGFEFNGQSISIRTSSLAKFFVKTKRQTKRTIRSAYGNNKKGGKVLTKRLYYRFTHFGNRNFITYAQRVIKQTATSGDASVRLRLLSKIKKQIAPHNDKFRKYLIDTNNRIYTNRVKTNRNLIKKTI